MIEIGRHAASLPDGLTTSTDKAKLFAVDTYFVEAWQDVQRRMTDPVGWSYQFGLLVLRPDAFVGRRAEAILDWLDRHRFSIVHAEPIRFDRHSIRALWRYQWNVATPERKALQEEVLTSGDSLLLIVGSTVSTHVPATVRLTDMKGPADPKDRQPTHLRHNLGSPSIIWSFLHTADEPADVIRELGIHFEAAARRRLLDHLAQPGDRRSDARTHVARMQRATVSHQLTATSVIDGLAGRLRGLWEQPATAPCEAEIAALIEDYRAGRSSRSWSRLPELAREAGVALTKWDELAWRAHHVQGNIEGLVPLVRTSARAWGEP